MSLHLHHPERTAAQDNPADLAREIRQFHAAMLNNARAAQEEYRNGLVVPSLMFRCALKDRIDRLCAALSVDAPLTPTEIRAIEDGRHRRGTDRTGDAAARRVARGGGDGVADLERGRKVMANAVLQREYGPIELLCKEISMHFQPEMETPEVLVAFVGELVRQIADEREILAAISMATKRPPSDGSAVVLSAAIAMLHEREPKVLIEAAGRLHDLADEHNPDGAYPTDHLIDMLSSCASAIRFGLEKPCRSRHAAEAAYHVWRILYGIKREDAYTSAWCEDWTRQMMQRALVSLASSPRGAPALASGDGE